MKTKCRWFQPSEILLRKGQRVYNAYLIVRGIVQCKTDVMPIYYRSGNIIGIDVLFARSITTRDTAPVTDVNSQNYHIDALFSQKYVANGTYTVSGELVEAYRIDATILTQLLNDENLARSIYHEIALHMVCNYYQDYLKLNRLQLRLLLHKHAKFYRNQPEVSIQLKENQRLLILSGTVIQRSNEQWNKHDAIQFNPSTIAYSSTDDDEVLCNQEIDFGTDILTYNCGLISTDLL